MKFFIIIVTIFLIGKSNCQLRKVYSPPPSIDVSKSGDPGQPLILTPYIKNGQIDEARQLSKVGPLPNTPNITSYSGFFTVNQTYNSNMFFWFFPALNQAKDAPTLLWLQGGPGGSSMFGLFVEHGPFSLNSDLSADIRKFTWANEFNIVYIDNPVGTGFSFTQDSKGYAKNEFDVARDLYEALQQFFTVFYELRPNDFYVTGESYAGKYVPALAYKIHSEGLNANINLKGIAIGDGLCDPQTMFDYGDYLYQIGLLDENQADHFRSEQSKAVNYINSGQYFEAFKIFDSLLNGDLLNTTSYFYNATGLKFYYNFLFANQPKEFGYYTSYLNLAKTKNAIHVGNLSFNEGSEVEMHLVNDIMQSVKPWVSVLMDNYKVLMYSGQLDIIVAAPLTESFLKSVNWKYSKEYKSANRFIWKVSPNDDEVAGYVRQVHGFYQVIVRNAGHILPYDQPKRAYDMIRRFVYDQSF